MNERKGIPMGNLGAKALRAAALMALACALVALTAVPAFAATRIHDVTFVAATADGSVTFAGEGFSIWKVTDEDGSIAPAFAGVENPGDEATWAAALAQAAAGVAADAEFATGADGTASLVLEKGAYLVVGSDAKAGDVTYSAVPYVMDLTDRSLSGSLTSYVKYTSDGPAPIAPGGDDKNGVSAETAGLATTGDAAVAAALFAMAAAAALCAVVVRKRTRCDGKEGL